MKQGGFLGFLLGLFILAVAHNAQAATLYMQPQNAVMSRGDTMAVSVRLDTDEEECVNVVDGVITYSENIQPVDTSRGSSILSMWVEDPVIDRENRTITFAGGIPNGYCGRIPGDPRLSNVIIELLFSSPGMVVGQVPELDEAFIDFDPRTRVLLNDGFGTQAPLSTYGAEIILTKQAGAALTNEWSERIAADTLPPEPFRIELMRTPNAFSNRYYIIFNTTDKQSGLSHYEVIEEPLEELYSFNWGAATAPWVKARSPYVLRDQSLNSTIRVRALDKAGNEYVATLVPDESQRTLSLSSQIMLIVIGLVLLVFMIGGLAVFWWYFRRRHDSASNQSDEYSM